jgi:hypothetical protein
MAPTARPCVRETVVAPQPAAAPQNSAMKLLECQVSQK